MALFGYWLQNLLNGGSQQPAIAGAGASMPPPQMQQPQGLLNSPDIERSSMPHAQTSADPGFFSFMRSDPGAPGTAQPIGPTNGRMPLSGSDKTAMLFGGLHDAVNEVFGRPNGDYLNSALKQARDERTRNAIAAAFGTNGMPANINVGTMIQQGVDPAMAISIFNATSKQQQEYDPTVHYSGNKAYLTAKDGTIKMLEGVQQPNNPNEPFNADGTPNAAYQAYELKMKSTGVPKAPKAQKPDPSSVFANPGQF